MTERGEGDGEGSGPPAGVQDPQGPIREAGHDPFQHELEAGPAVAGLPVTAVEPLGLPREPILPHVGRVYEANSQFERHAHGAYCALVRPTSTARRCGPRADTRMRGGRGEEVR